MATSIETFFEVEGITLNDKVDVISGSNDPRDGAGTVARMGSMLLRTNGETWKKVGIGAKDWALASGDGVDDDSAYALILKSIMVSSDYEVEVDIGTVAFNHYYEDGAICTLKPSNYYQHNITIKNLSGLPLEIKPEVGRIEGKKKYILDNRFSSITISPLQNDWVIISVIEGQKYVLVPSCTPCDHTTKPNLS